MIVVFHVCLVSKIYAFCSLGRHETMTHIGAPRGFGDRGRMAIYFQSLIKKSNLESILPYLSTKVQQHNFEDGLIL